MINNTEIKDTLSGRKKNQEENPIFVAQRYLNIFHQIHIFNAAKKEEFIQTLLKMPEHIREILPSIPGGRIMLKYINELAEERGLQKDEEQQLLKNNESQQLSDAPHVASPSMPAIQQSAPIAISSDFAQNLATSLAQALKENNLSPASSNENFNELSAVLSRSLSSYASNMQQITENILSHNMEQFSEIQEKNVELFNKTQNQVLQQLSSNTSLSRPNGDQLNTQNNNTNATTINNVNIDSSAFKDLSQTIKESEAQRHNDFKQIIEALHKSLSNLPKNQEVSISSITDSFTAALQENGKQQVEAIKTFGEIIAQTIIQSQQDFARKISEQNNAQPIYITIGKQGSQPVYIAADSQDVKPVFTPSQTITTETDTPIKTETESENKQTNNNSFIKNVSEKIAQTTSKLAQNFKSPEKNKDSQQSEAQTKNEQKNNKQKEKQKDKQSEKQKNKKNDNRVEQSNQKKFEQDRTDNKLKQKGNEKKSNPNVEQSKTHQRDDLNLDDFLSEETPVAQVEEIDFNTSSLNNSDTNNFSDSTSIKADFSAIDADDLLPQIKEDRSIESLPTLDEPINPEIKTESQSKSDIPQDEDENPKQSAKAPKIKAYDDAMLKIKEALKSNEVISLNEIDDSGPVSLNNEDVDSAFAEDLNQPNTDPMDDSFYEDTYDQSSNTASDDADWEYVDENGNPVSADDGDWEYVDENGNPVPTDDSDWEYVDENGNPVPAGDGDWEYIDENGNSVSADDSLEYDNTSDNNDIANAFAEDLPQQTQQPTGEDNIENAFKDNQPSFEQDNLSQAFNESTPKETQNDELSAAFENNSDDALLNAFDAKNT